MRRQIITALASIFLCSTPLSLAAEDSDKTIEMLNSEGKLKFQNSCVMAVADEVFCSCLSNRIGAYLVDSFSTYAAGMSFEKRDSVRAEYLEAIKNEESVNNMLSNWEASRDICRAKSKNAMH